MKLLTATIDGKHVGFSSDTDFLVQVGKGKSSYATIATCKGNLAQAVIMYNGLNVGNGHKKRLLMPSCSSRPVLARLITY